MPSYRKGRINEAIAQELCVALREARDPVIAEAFVSVTRAEAAPDLKIAKVYFSHLAGEEKEVKKALNKGKDIILEIEVDGAMQVKRKIRNSVAIMLTPPDFKTLEARLRGRGTEKEEDIIWRLDRAKEEILLLPKYDYSVINENGKARECADLIYNIIKAEHQKTKNTKKELIKKFI